MTSIRKPLLKKRPSGKFKMHPFQVADITEMMERDSSANWSELCNGLAKN